MYTPNLFQKLLSYLLFPLSKLYFSLITWKYQRAKEHDLGVKVIGVGNLVVGGSGKTPLVIALASNFSKVAVVLRGYGRQSRGLHVVSDAKNILCDVSVSGDEAMIYAKRLNHTVVIVSENRVTGIEKAKSMGAEVVFLDDAYAKHTIKKLDLVIEVATKNNFYLPSGPYRETLHEGKNITLLQEGRDFTRKVSFLNKKSKMALLTAIARPQRLDAFLCEGVVSKHYFEDHHTFTKEEALKILKESGADSLLVTYKDYVKLSQFDLELSLMDLEIKVDQKIMQIVKDYVEKEN